MLRNLKHLIGFELGATDGILGKIKDFYFDDQVWAIRYFVVDTGNWLVGRQVLISPASVGLPEEELRLVNTRLNKRQIEESPSIEEDKPVSRHHEIDYSAYYGWPAYWEGPYIWGGATVPYAFPPTVGALAEENPLGKMEESARQSMEKGDPHLRSYREVTGYHIEARDGEIGHISDFLIDEQSWRIHYLIADTRNWLPGKKVLLSPAWIDSVVWAEGKVTAKVLREDVRQAPEYEQDMQLTEDFQRQLNEYYENTLRYQSL